MELYMASISGDNAYHARLRKRIQEYQEIIASSNPPVMIQDTPARMGFVQSGNTPYNFENVVSAGLGGREYKTKKKGVSKLLRTVGTALRPLGKTIKPIKKALVDRAVQEIGAPYQQSPVYAEYDEQIPQAYDLGLPALPKGGKVNRMKKATKWLGFAKDVADTGLDLFDKVKSRVGGRAPSPWILEVKATRVEMEKESGGPVSYKMAMQEASRRRKA